MSLVIRKNIKYKYKYKYKVSYLLVLNFALDIFDRVGTLALDRYRFSGERLLSKHTKCQ